jgi:hypothetical protein
VSRDVERFTDAVAYHGEGPVWIGGLRFVTFWPATSSPSMATAPWWTGYAYGPAGTLEEVLDLPVTQVTACAFGSDGLEELYITTSRENLPDEEQPQAGSVFRARALRRRASAHAVRRLTAPISRWHAQASVNRLVAQRLPAEEGGLAHAIAISRQAVALARAAGRPRRRTTARTRDPRTGGVGRSRHASPLTVTAPVNISVPTPFPPGCGGPTEGNFPGENFKNPDSETEPWIAVSPANPTTSQACGSRTAGPMAARTVCWQP